VPMPRPPKFRRCSGVSEKISEVLEKSALRKHLCSPFITDVFFARVRPGEPFFYRRYRGKEFGNVVERCLIIESNLGDAKMKKILISTAATVALLATSLAAQAADLPQKVYAPPPVAVAMVYDWTGFYIGANGGYGSNRACWGSFGAGLVADGCNSKSGGVIGGQGGYRWQWGQAVFGVEAEGDWANMRASLPTQLPAFPGGTDSANVTSVGLFTGQIGYAANAALFYLKGGAALANNSFLVQNAAGVGQFFATSHKLGATVGVGFEYGFTQNWSAGIEYDHLMMGNANNSFSVPAGVAAVANTISQNIDIVTLRLNYRFGGPVVARY
jgi:outer membrane immunogenic protein